MELNTFVRCVADSIQGLECVELSAETDFKALKEWDSLAILTVTDSIDLEYGVLLKRSDYESCADITALFELVRSKR